MNNVVTRFAPSPTGMLHVGGARTALISYMMAMSLDGKFIIRIEDTDKERSSKEMADNIMFDISWMGIEYDELSFQSGNYDSHLKQANNMIKNGLAYKKDGAVFIRVGDNKIDVFDNVKGRVTFDGSNIKDFVIVRSCGTPSFMLANAVDDCNSGVTHIIRGDDHFSNAAKQNIIYDALSYSPQTYHIPLVLGSDKKKLSKRNGGITINELRNLGIPKNVIISHLLKLGVSISDDYIFNLDNAVRLFSPDKIRNSASIFDLTHMKRTTSKFIASYGFMSFIKDDFPDAFNIINSSELYDRIVDVEHSISEKINDVVSACDILLELISEDSRVFVDKNLDQSIVDFSHDTIMSTLNNYCEESGVSKGRLFRSIRESLNPSGGCPFSISDLIYIRGRSHISS